ncbi:hypothetical protein P154DRAFT_526464 [Amniculicola lignicola CBS 123094]|uniref:Uncharacterized protein n=1 Tax=Amniculicola lignicola CBS 123094 TaxID=1392246 RepID=A0A6A5W0N7_9PLEO|nr:hypothetical protein P154DRAFT_526464 [Amniculicola lignicola CBS 123094]
MAASSAPTLQSIPVELRHEVYQWVSVREDKPKKLIRRWFEKRDVAAQIAAQVSDPTVVTVLAAYDDHDDDDSEAAAEDDGEGEDDEDDDGEDNEQEDDEETEVAAEDDDGDGEGEEVDDDGDVAMADADSVVAAPPALPIRKFYPARKWHHIPKFLRIDRFPPAKEVLLISKQFNREAKAWYYDTAVLKINATASFLHTSFFEESLQEIADAAFSPMENIRKVEVTFVWDTAWLREDGHDWGAAVFPALLDERARFVQRILERAPDLKQLVVHWHDSCEDEESEETKLKTLTRFMGIRGATFDLKEHYIASDAKPDSRSLAGLLRLEFQDIANNGWQVK